MKMKQHRLLLLVVLLIIASILWNSRALGRLNTITNREELSFKAPTTKTLHQTTRLDLDESFSNGSFSKRSINPNLKESSSPRISRADNNDSGVSSIRLFSTRTRASSFATPITSRREGNLSKDATNAFTKRPTTNDARPKQMAGLAPFHNASIAMAPPIPTGWWSLYLHQTARIYQPWKGKPYEWCLPITKESKESSDALVSEEYSPAHPATGLLYVKSHKASSSTCEGINLAIAHHVARRVHGHDDVHVNGTTFICRHENRHYFANAKGHGQRGPPSLLWTFVRHPAKRDLSQVYHFRVSRNRMTPTDANIIGAISNHANRGRQTRYLLPFANDERQMTPQQVKKNPNSTAKVMHRQLFQYYDFIGITERMDESLAVMTLLWDLRPPEVIVLSSKQAGGYDGGGSKHKCTKIEKAVVTRVVEAYLKSNNYTDGNADLLLYYAAVLSLDMTIQALGTDVVRKRASEIHGLRELADTKCADHAIYPCSAHGKLQLEAAKESCYVQDAGCAYKCVDSVHAQHSTTLI
jgi:hypothetical protein